MNTAPLYSDKHSSKLQLWFTIFMALAVVVVGNLLATQNQHVGVDMSPPTNVIANMTSNNKTVIVPLGQKLQINLNSKNWNLSDPSNQKLLVEQSKTLTNANSRHPLGSETILYTTHEQGFTTLSGIAVNRPDCRTHQMCPQFIAIERYQIQVDVVQSNAKMH
jgi:hypothetical protein